MASNNNMNKEKIVDLNAERKRRENAAAARSGDTTPEQGTVSALFVERPPYMDGQLKAQVNIDWLSRRGFGVMMFSGPWVEASVLAEVQKVAPTVAILVREANGARQFVEQYYDVPVRLYAPQLAWEKGITGNFELSIPITATAGEVDAFIRTNIAKSKKSNWARTFFQTLKK